jgi:CMP-N,N'-diacetyllegionaminic acid synthase
MNTDTSNRKAGRVLGLITARGGSKGVPGKNIKFLAGKPLIVWTIEAALASGRIDRLILSTDSDEIAAVAKAAGCEVPFMRPPTLATDTATSNDVIRHALETIDSNDDRVVLLQPTSPLREPQDINGCLDTQAASGGPFAVSVCVADPPPEHIFRIDANQRLSPVIKGPNASRRQDLQSSYALNGAVYAFERAWFLAADGLQVGDAVPYVMPAERSIDIDTELDFIFAEMCMTRRKNTSV